MKNNLSPSDKFYGPKLKIERAKQHIGDLNDQLGEFAKGNPYVVRVESPADPKRCNLIIRVKKPMSPCIMLTSGDAIHNLRSALDLLACDIVRPFNAGDTKGVYFPFGKSADDFEGRIKQRKIDLAGPKIVDIMRSLKAYPGGNDPLCSIHELDITDKHIAMLETRSLGLMPDVVGAINIINTVFGPLNDGKGFIGGLSSGFVSA